MDLISAMQHACTPPDRRPVYEWASDYVENPKSWTQYGRFSVSRSMHFCGPFDALTNNRIKRVCILKPVRGGGSLISDVWLPYIVSNDPGPCMFVMQSSPVAIAHAKTRLIPILQQCPPTAALIPDDPRKLTSEGVILNNGVPLYFQGNALGRLQSKGIRYLSLDEVWEWDDGLVRQAMARTGDYDLLCNSKQLLISQGGTEGTEWENLWGESDQQEWLVPCLGCGKYFIPRFNGKRKDGTYYGIVWDSNEKTKYADGTHNYGEITQTLRYVCEHCGYAHANEQLAKAEWNRRGRYEPQNPRPVPGVAGFHWHGLIFKNWSEMAIDYIKAKELQQKGSIEPYKQIVQKQWADHWRDDMLFKHEKIELSSYNSEWPDEKFRFITCDVMGEEMWFVCRAWAASGASRRIAFGRFHTWDELVELAKKHNVRPNNVFIDSGWETQPVYYQCALHGWIALKGADKPSFPHEVRKHGRHIATVHRPYSTPAPKDPLKGTNQQGKKMCVLILWSNQAIKPIVKRLRDGKGQEWLLGSAQGVNATDEEYNSQIHSEYPVVEEDKNGFKKRIWKKAPNKENHAWDCECESAVAAAIVGILEIEVRSSSDDAPNSEEPQPTEKLEHSRDAAPHEN